MELESVIVVKCVERMLAACIVAREEEARACDV